LRSLLDRKSFEEQQERSGKSKHKKPLGKDDAFPKEGVEKIPSPWKAPGGSAENCPFILWKKSDPAG
jgi:hypothetical protein